MKFEVDTNLLIHCRVRVTVDVANREAASDAASELMPQNWRPNDSSEWGAKVELKPPKGVKIKVLRAIYFEEASGDERVRKARE